MPYVQLMYNLAKQDRENDLRAMDLVSAMEKHGLTIDIRAAHEVILDMHEMAKERRLRAITDATT